MPDARLPVVGTALVRGAALPAWLAARVLAERCERVFVAADTGERASAAATGILAQRELEALFPGLTATLLAAGRDDALVAELRRRVLARPNVQAIDGAAASAFDPGMLDLAIDCIHEPLGAALARALALRDPRRADPHTGSGGAIA